jgi:hypothetical protein
VEVVEPLFCKASRNFPELPELPELPENFPKKYEQDR